MPPEPEHAAAADALERPAPAAAVRVADAAPSPSGMAPLAQTAPAVEREESMRPDVEPAPTLPPNAPDIPRVSLDLPADSGLVLVETSHTPPPTESEPEVHRPGRARPPRTSVAEEPLQMVETTHKDPPAM